MNHLFSILYEVLVAMQNKEMQNVTVIIGKSLLHLCIHIMGIHMFVMSQVTRRSTFWKIGQSVMAKRDLQIEKQIKEKMIHSRVTPIPIATKRGIGITAYITNSTSIDAVKLPMVDKSDSA
jgi:hypothetical protein